jgi:hypothetical protein
MSTLNPQLVHETAAYLFWMFAEQVGVADANIAVIDTAGQCLLMQPFTVSVLVQHSYEKLSQEDQQRFMNAIACEAEKLAVKETNMNGIVYAEDAQSGRSPSAMSIDTKVLKAIPSRIVTNFEVAKTGCLCLRHPLPAVVFSDHQPRKSFIEVADTSTALGFHLPMFLSTVGCQKISNSLVVLLGIFYIPVPDESRGYLWNSAILNSTRFSSELELFDGSSVTMIEAAW